MRYEKYDKKKKVGQWKTMRRIGSFVKKLCEDVGRGNGFH